MTEILEVMNLTGYPPEIGAALWRLEDARRRTLDTLKDLPAAYLDNEVHENTIGTILYHIALIEMDWLFVEVLNEEFPDEVVKLFPEDCRDSTGKLTQMNNLSLDQHLARLQKSRDILMEKFKHVTEEEFHQNRVMPQYEVSPEWVLHHLAQHEAEHRGEIGVIINLIKKSISK